MAPPVSRYSVSAVSPCTKEATTSHMGSTQGSFSSASTSASSAAVVQVLDSNCDSGSSRMTCPACRASDASRRSERSSRARRWAGSVWPPCPTEISVRDAPSREDTSMLRAR